VDLCCGALLTRTQTWEDPNATHPDTKAKGDDDPLDVCEIGEQVGYVGQIKQVKVLGVMALLDEGETDWKIIVIDVNDPLAPKLNDIEDVERHLPGLIRATNEWFRVRQRPIGSPLSCADLQDPGFASSVKRIRLISQTASPRTRSRSPARPRTRCATICHPPLTRQKYALEIILETHEAWKRLIAGQPPQTSDIAMCVRQTSVLFVARFS